MKCPKCGSELLPESNFCTNCGTTIEQAQPPQQFNGAAPPNGAPVSPNGAYNGNFQPNMNQQNYQYGAPDQKPPKKSNNSLMVVIAVLSLIIAATAVILLIWFMKSDKDDSSSDKSSSAPTSTAAVSTTAESTDEVTTSAAETLPETTQPATEPETQTDAPTEPAPADTGSQVPDVVGLSSEDAMRKLTDAGFDFEINLTPSDSVEANYVISQSPLANKTVDPGTKIMVYVSNTAQSSQGSNNYVTSLYCCASEFATLRQYASRNAAALARIPSRGEVQYISSYGEFYYVCYNGQYGYVLGEFFATSPNAPLNTSSGVASSTTLYCRASISATLRNGPSRNNASLAQIPSRSAVTYVSDASAEFYYVCYNGTYGYVLKDYFSTDANAPLNYGTY